MATGSLRHELTELFVCIKAHRMTRFQCGRHSTPSNASTKPQPNDCTHNIPAAGRGFNVGSDAAPRRPRAAILRQVPYKLPHVVERPKRHDFWDHERPRQRARPIRGRHGYSLALAQRDGRAGTRRPGRGSSLGQTRVPAPLVLPSPVCCARRAEPRPLPRVGAPGSADATTTAGTCKTMTPFPLCAGSDRLVVLRRPDAMGHEETHAPQQIIRLRLKQKTVSLTGMPFEATCRDYENNSLCGRRATSRRSRSCR